MQNTLQSIIATAKLRNGQPTTASALFELLRDIEGMANSGLKGKPPEQTASLLQAYQLAFNQIDDLMEYRVMSKEQFKGIAKALSDKILKIMPPKY